MEFDGNTQSGAPLGSDNENILAAKRRRYAENASAAASSSALNATKLRAQMKNGATPGAASSAPAQRPARPSAAASPAKRTGAQGAAHPMRSTSVPTDTGVQKTAAPASQGKNPAAAARPANRQSAPAGGSAPVRQSTPQPRPTNPASEARTSQPRPARSAGVSRPDAARMDRIPAMPTGRGVQSNADNEKTKVTDMSLVRTPPRNMAEQTRQTDIRELERIRREAQDDDVKDESEGGNTIISVIKAITYIVAVVTVSVFLSVFIILVGNDIYALVKDDTVVDVIVPDYATLDDVADILHENSIIAYPNIFKFYANFKNDDGVFLSGSYSLSPMMNYDELLAAFKPKKPSGVSRITIPEGYTTDEIIDLFVSRGIGTREGYVDVINNYEFDYWFIEALGENWADSGRFYRLDGYLFPDTYDFYNASSEEVVIGKLLKRFNQVFVDDYSHRAEELGYTVDQVLTLASMIEEESGSQSDFFYVSSVFNNRLRNPASYPCLESDATVVYAIHHDTGERINPTAEDLAYESPYNTYTNKGLPPGPISNPSAGAIRAALYPSETKYYYFYAVSAHWTVYSTTYEEHLQVIDKALNGTLSENE